MNESYILVPGFDYHHLYAINPGDIVADWREPTKTLSSPTKPAILALHTDVEGMLKSDDELTTLHGQLWTRFMRFADTAVGGGGTVLDPANHFYERLDTIHLHDYPTNEEATERSLHPEVQSVMRSGFGRTSVFMITGIKVAEGFTMRRPSLESRETKATITARLLGTEADPGLVEAEAIIGGHEPVVEEWQPPADIVYAYEVSTVHFEECLSGPCQIHPHVPRAGAALLHDKKGEQRTEAADDYAAYLKTLRERAADVFLAEQEGLRNLTGEMDVEVVELTDGTEKCDVVMFNTVPR
ncbi:uncharacterized protein BO72DRAFT_451721 [Aspergillus fijiensis CBS 313.89]|uniref:Uncharacterized protein n=1 Tax=Aspergillus fijiensis CBS 313.89 TaxID=1448319 RepID=A0A8G1RIN2_9EURO|nr:uncharacterized protein BO72DRAFT_451721 [Aspergillus fijiensis CBS 313.89]RAK73529.1 hypothetical protein BO72DRAFT_451721 [Aspergillus fijiensis CBS 313.89]